MTDSHRKNIHISYFAGLREARGISEELFETSALTAADLYTELQGQHGFGLAQASLKVSINDEFSPWQTELKNGDRIVFIPPVSGG
jgi:molybdopterin converting factor small subunit